MRLIIFLILASILAGCATVDFQPYEREGATKLVVDGVHLHAGVRHEHIEIGALE